MAALTQEQKRKYDDQGYVLLKSLFEPEELQPLIGEFEARVDKAAREYHADGRIKSLYEDHGFKTRLLKLVDDCVEVYEELHGRDEVGPELFNILKNTKLLDIVEGILGPEIRCEGRHTIRPKLPNFGVANFNWHEDTRYEAKRTVYVQQPYGLGTDATKLGSFQSRIVAAPLMAEPNFWIPLVDVDEANGCLQVLPGGHGHTPPYVEQWGPDTFVPQLEGLLPLPVPMQVGDALLMHQHLPHFSPANRSDHVRWSMDIRFQDSRLKTKAGTTTPGFIARSKERPQDVVTEYEGYMRLRKALQEFKEAEEEFKQKTGVRL
jgi:phytanoyl-CoA hydroxylase